MTPLQSCLLRTQPGLLQAEKNAIHVLVIDWHHNRSLGRHCLEVFCSWMCVPANKPHNVEGEVETAGKHQKNEDEVGQQIQCVRHRWPKQMRNQEPARRRCPEQGRQPDDEAASDECCVVTFHSRKINRASSTMTKTSRRRGRETVRTWVGFEEARPPKGSFTPVVPMGTVPTPNCGLEFNCAPWS